MHSPFTVDAVEGSKILTEETIEGSEAVTASANSATAAGPTLGASAFNDLSLLDLEPTSGSVQRQSLLSSHSTPTAENTTSGCLKVLIIDSSLSKPSI